MPGMILLENGSKILAETLRSFFNSEEETKKEMNVSLCDFDGATYKVVYSADTPNDLFVSMYLPCYKQLLEGGIEPNVRSLYPEMTEPLENADITLKLDPNTKAKDELIERVSLIKSNVVGAIFDIHFTGLLNDSVPQKPFKFDMRPDTTIYIVPSKDRVVVIFSLDFKENTDRVVAKVFMQEFADARRQQGLGGSPPVQWSAPPTKPPMELAQFGITDCINNLGFISFAVLKSHVDKGKKDKAVQTFQAFRNFIQYHIKCSKAFFHSRMRSRVTSLLTLLNRAKVDQGDNTKKTTISGKTFVRT